MRRLARLGAAAALLVGVALSSGAAPAAALAQPQPNPSRATAGGPAAFLAAPGALGAQPAAAPGAFGTAAAGTGTAPAGAGGLPATVAPPRIGARAALLADEETGQVLFERASRQPRAMASTTKVMTALLSLQRLDQSWTEVIGTEPTRVGEESLELRQGERLTVRQLLLGLLVKSANDAAVALADAVDGSEAAFVRRMNRKAAELRLDATHYVTAYGLDRPGHHTSARDLARLWEAAMRRADFRALVSTRTARLPGPERARRLASTNLLLGSYAWTVGGKTGFTGDAGRCLVASASRGGRRLVAVALGSQDAFADVRALFEYGFDAFDRVSVAQRGQAVTLATAGGQARSYQVTADVDALVRRDLLDELRLAPPARLAPVAAPAAGSAAGPGAAPPGAPATVWVQAGGLPLAPLRLGPPGVAPAPGLGPATVSSLAPALVAPGSEPAAIDPFLRRPAS